MELILASGSPRRRQLLQQAGYVFRVVAPDDSAESVAGIELSPIELVSALAFQKAKYVAAQTDRGLILAADTVADCGGKVLGKPSDRSDAGRMLKTLRGTTHYVHTGICLWSRPDNRKLIQSETTELQMSELSDSQIEAYLDSGLWRGKAGAFGYQDDIPWITVTRGSESNVVGLPMELLANMLEQLKSTSD